jgi:hypothetical protein
MTPRGDFGVAAQHKHAPSRDAQPLINARLATSAEKLDVRAQLVPIWIKSDVPTESERFWPGSCSYSKLRSRIAHIQTSAPIRALVRISPNTFFHQLREQKVSVSLIMTFLTQRDALLYIWQLSKIVVFKMVFSGKIKFTSQTTYFVKYCWVENNKPIIILEFLYWFRNTLFVFALINRITANFSNLITM